ncbi:hypothetical protein G6F66_014742 [Rhizopus arrhizus]|nr:hypothetical protein G6F66_014742 [Rhizopus arrhizus]
MNKTLFASALLALPLSLSAAPQPLHVPLPAPAPGVEATAPAPAAAPSAFAQLDAAQQRQRRADYAAWRALPGGTARRPEPRLHLRELRRAAEAARPRPDRLQRPGQPTRLRDPACGIRGRGR